MLKRNSMQYAKDIKEAILKVQGLTEAYNTIASANAIDPYAVFEVRALGESMLVIEVDLWSCKGAEIELQDIADELEAMLDGYIIANDYHTSMLVSNNDMKWVADSDENVIRINLSFSATYQA